MQHDGWYSLALAEADRADRQAELIISLLDLTRSLLNELKQYTAIDAEEERWKEMQEEFLSTP